MDRRAILGAIFVVLGILFLADNLGWLSFSIWDTVFSLPMFAIVIGILQVNKRRHTTFGIILVVGGLVFLIPRIFNIHYDTDHLFWPVALVLLGIYILFHKRDNSKEKYRQDFAEWERSHHFSNHKDWKEWKKNYKRTHEYSHHWFDKGESSAEYLDELNIFGGCEKKITTKSFRGGKVTSIFGGATFDFRDCELAEGKNVLDIANLFGGTKLILPSHWKVHVDIVSIFGGFSDKRIPNQNIAESDRELHIVGVVFFGGGEIKSY